MSMIKSSNIHVAIISEANYGIIKAENELEFNDLMSGYRIEAKCLPNDNVSRLVCIIKEGVEYERKFEFENEHNPAIFLKIKTSN